MPPTDHEHHYLLRGMQEVGEKKREIVALQDENRTC